MRTARPAPNAGAAALAKVLTDKAGGRPVKLTQAQFNALGKELEKIAKAGNTKIAMSVANLLTKKHKAGDFDITDIRAIPSHGSAVRNALIHLKDRVDLADGRRDENLPPLAK